MAIFWLPYFRTKYQSWHDGGIYSDWTKDEMMKSLYRKVKYTFTYTIYTYILYMYVVRRVKEKL